MTSLRGVIGLTVWLEGVSPTETVIWRIITPPRLPLAGVADWENYTMTNAASTGLPTNLSHPPDRQAILKCHQQA